MSNYYSQNLSAERLQLCYKLSPARIKQYLKSEINTVLQRIKNDDYVLEIGCGYGRILKEAAKRTENIFGVDISFDNLKYGCDKYLKGVSRNLIRMNAIRLGLSSDRFDLVFCIQNGISAIKESPEDLIG